MSVFLNDWSGENGQSQMLENFYIGEAAISGFSVLVASYTYECYSGSAYVLLRENATGDYFEVHASHCSCYGLEDQWSPEKADPEEILHRINNGSWGEEHKIADYIRVALGVVA